MMIRTSYWSNTYDYTLESCTRYVVSLEQSQSQFGHTGGMDRSMFAPTLKFRMLPVLGSATKTTVSASTPQKSLIASPAPSIVQQGQSCVQQMVAH